MVQMYESVPKIVQYSRNVPHVVHQAAYLAYGHYDE